MKRKFYSVAGQVIGERAGNARTNYLTDALGSVTQGVQGVKNTAAVRYSPYGEKATATPGTTFAWVGNHYPSKPGEWRTGPKGGGWY